VEPFGRHQELAAAQDFLPPSTLRQQGMSTKQLKPIEILLVEDNPADITTAKEALADTKVAKNLHVVNDGAQAILFVRKQEQYAGAPTPDLILLDLNLPIKSGFEVLTELKNDDDLKLIPVVVLTSSKEEGDIIRAYDCGANCYITKPQDFTHSCELLPAIERFWSGVVTLPPKDHGQNR
jgi:CheY-like chemotaxis protein